MMEIMEDDDQQQDEYFDAYGDTDVHEIMLKDKIRNKVYMEAIIKCKHLIEGRIVLDVGAGSGILSLFAAKYGHPRKVYAVEASPINVQLKRIIDHNGMADLIEIFPFPIEDVILPEQVDVIISEWMGFYLLHESMIRSVIFARDHHLKEGGLIFPEIAILKASPSSFSQLFSNKLEFWEDIEGFDFSSMMEPAAIKLLSEPQISFFPKEELLSPPTSLVEIDMRTVSPDFFDKIENQLEFSADRSDRLGGLVLWFEIHFQTNHGPLVLDTSPFSEPTHWKQTGVIIPESLPVTKGQTIKGTFSLQRVANSRRYGISVDLCPQEDADIVALRGGHDPDCDCVKCAVMTACLHDWAKTK